jgi:hypothetical protein
MASIDDAFRSYYTVRTGPFKGWHIQSTRKSLGFAPPIEICYKLQHVLFFLEIIGLLILTQMR